MATDQVMPRNDPRTLQGWALFDWANSAYALTIAVAVFPAYFEEVTDAVIVWGGRPWYNTTLFAMAVAGSYFLIALMSPFLSGVADYSGRKKVFLRFFTWVGAVGCMALYFFPDGGGVGFGLGAFMLATLGFAGSLVFYHAYLPEIATPDQYNRVSAKGFAYGYAGSVLLLMINLAVILRPAWFGLPVTDTTLPARLSFLSVGLWWIFFARMSIRRLPPDRPVQVGPAVLAKGWGALRSVWREARQDPNILYFLLAFFCYSAGVQTILSLASLFAKVEVGMDTAELILVILLLQFLGLAGAFLFARLCDRIGNKRGMSWMLVFWTLLCGAGYFVYDKWQFYLLAVGVGLVMGGVQSQSRATYAKLLPERTKEATSFFSFYDVLEKSATAVGSFSFAFTGELMGGMRPSVLALGFFFLLGIAFLRKVRFRAGQG